MAAAWCSTWQDDGNLKSDLNKYVLQGLQRREILDFVKRDFSYYAWSIRTLDRRLKEFGITYIDKPAAVSEVVEAVRKEMEGPGKLLGYRAMHLKVRQKYDLKVPRDKVYAVMYDIDPDLLENRRPGLKKKRKENHFTTKGSNWVFSVDGHDKLMGYQNSTFPLAVYGCIDTASRKIMWLRIWTTNSKPELIGKWYLEHLFETRTLPAYLRMDHGTETGKMATMQAFLRKDHPDLKDPTDSVIYGPSTANQIERWWRELHERLEKFFKHGLSWLLQQNHYDRFDENDRSIMAYVMIPMIQRELDEFKDIVWNPHRIRKQKETYMPDGIPNHIYAFPEEYGMKNCGFSVTEEDLKTVAEVSGVLQVEEDYLDPSVRKKFEATISDPNAIESTEYVQAYLRLKENLSLFT